MLLGIGSIFQRFDSIDSVAAAPQCHFELAQKAVAKYSYRYCIFGMKSQEDLLEIGGVRLPVIDSYKNIATVESGFKSRRIERNCINNTAIVAAQLYPEVDFRLALI